jgi:FeS assembly SUF system regulator
MIKLNRITDYAVVVLAHMAREPERLVTAPQLSHDSAVPLPTVSKVLKELAREGVLTSHRGVNGGYTLSRRPEDISVLEIVGALEGPVALTSCVEEAEDDCSVESLCPMRGNWNKVNAAIRGALSSVTLADMALPAMTFAPPSVAAPAPAPAE